MKWLSNNCSNNYIMLKKENKKLRENKDKLRRECEALKDRLNGVEDQVKNIKINLATEVKELVLFEMKENNEKERKKDNLMIYNIPEAEEKGLAGEDRKEKDIEVCQKIFVDEVKVEGVKIVNTYRLGKQRSDDKPRPLLVKLEETRIKWEILKNGKNLRNSTMENMKKIFISPDKTLKERERERELRDALREKRDKGENDWCINYKEGRIQKRNFREEA